MINCALCCSDLAKHIINKTSTTNASCSGLKRNYFFLFCLWHFPSHQTNQRRCEKRKMKIGLRKSIPGNCASGLKKLWWWCCDWKPNDCWKMMKAWCCLLRDPRLICWSSRVEGGGGPWQSPGSKLARGLCSFLLWVHPQNCAWYYCKTKI